MDNCLATRVVEPPQPGIALTPPGGNAIPEREGRGIHEPTRQREVGETLGKKDFTSQERVVAPLSEYFLLLGVWDKARLSTRLTYRSVTYLR